MELMNLRRGLMAQMAETSRLKTATIIAPSNMSTADIVASWLRSSVPNSEVAFIVRQDFYNASINNLFLAAMVTMGEPNVYARYRDQLTQPSTQWTSQYSLVVQSGDEYKVCYKPIRD